MSFKDTLKLVGWDCYRVNGKGFRLSTAWLVVGVRYMSVYRLLQYCRTRKGLSFVSLPLQLYLRHMRYKYSLDGKNAGR